MSSVIRLKERLAFAALVVTSVCVVSTTDANAGAAPADARQDASRHVAAMNFRQISQGHFSSLGGRWTQVAQGSDAYGADGLHYSRAGTLKVTAGRIVMGGVVVRGRTLSDGQSLRNARLVFTRQHNYLNAGLKNQSVAINYVVQFYPRGVPLRLFTSSKRVKISKSKNRIVLWTSNNSFTRVYSQK